jgi:hypothetical protein
MEDELHVFGICYRPLGSKVPVKVTLTDRSGFIVAESSSLPFASQPGTDASTILVSVVVSGGGVVADLWLLCP